MFRSKKEVDSHVTDLLSKLSNEKEKVQKCLTIAKQYASIREFDSAKRYIETYLGSSSSNTAEAFKLLGDIQLESNEEEKALESYKSAYDKENNREALNRVCDLLSQGFGINETAETRRKWFDLQKSTSGNMDHQTTPSRQNGNGRNFYNSSAFVSRSFISSAGGPPKSGLNGSLISSTPNAGIRGMSSSPMKGGIQGVNLDGSIGSNSMSKQRGLGSCRVQPSPERMFMQMSYLEKKYEDVMDKIVGQNTEVLASMQLFKEEISDEIRQLREKVEHISLTQDQMLKDQTNATSAAAKPSIKVEKEEKNDSVKISSDNTNANVSYPQPVAHPPYNPYVGNPGVPPYPYNALAPNMYPPFFLEHLAVMSNPALMSLYGPGSSLMSANNLNQINQQPTLASMLASNASSASTPSSIGNFATGFNPVNLTAPTSSSLLGTPLQSTVPPTSVSVPISFNLPSNLAANSSGLAASATTPIASSNNNNSTPPNSSPFTPNAASTPPNSSKVNTASTPIVKPSTIPSSSNLPPNVVVSNTDKVPWPILDNSTSAAGIMSVIIPPEHRKSGNVNNDSNNSALKNKSLAEILRGGSEVTDGKDNGVKPNVTPAAGVQLGVNKPQVAVTVQSIFSSPVSSTPIQSQGPTPIGVVTSNRASVVTSTSTTLSSSPMPSFNFKMSNAGEVKLGDKSSDKPSPFANFNFSSTVTGFGDLAKGSPTSGFNKPADFKGFKGSEAPVFAVGGNNSSPATTTGSRPRTGSCGSEGEDDFVPTAEFKPVIPLPPLVEAKLGDENENVIFEHRAKLYRFDSENKEWKERGVGNIKILQDKGELQRVRVLMWREKVLKLAANHWVTGDMKVDYYQSSQKKILKWTAVDYAEDEPKPEIFTCRFGTEEKCAEFKAKFEEMIQLVANSPKAAPASSAEITSSATPAVTENMKPLSELFKKQEGSWDCSGCYINNKKDNIKCIACGSPQPGFEDQVAKEKEEESKKAAEKVANFSFGFKAPQTVDSPVNAATSDSSKANVQSTNTFGLPSTAAPFSFASISAATEVAKTTEVKTSDVFSNFSFSSPGFGELAKSSPSFGFGKQADFKGFAGEGKSVFGGTPTTGQRTRTTSGGSEGEDDFVPTAEFKPVIPLPPLVEAKLGDENENVIFEHRAKIYRFDSENKEWKERGVGNIKILQDKSELQRVRVLMWREKVLKLAANHWVTGDMKVDYSQSSQKKVLKWTAVDYAEDEPKPEIFTCRFGTEEKCAEFKAKLEEMIQLVASSPKAAQQISTSSAEKTSSAPSVLTDNLKPLSELFKKQEGSWDCSGCYINNKKENITCVACGSPQPGFEEQVAKEKEEESKKAAEKLANFSFGFKAPPTVDIPQKDTPVKPTNIQPTNTFGLSSSPAQFSFASLSAATDTSKDVEVKPSNVFSNFSFSSPGFGELAKSSPSFGFGKPADFKGFAGEGKSVFGGTPTTGQRTRTTSGGSEGEDDFVPTAEFKPVIPLPPLVEAKLGDENENVIFEHRAKIYRFDSENKEWKERGVGNIKILQDKSELQRVRVLMWREKVLKLAANHWVTGDMKVDQSGQKILKWTAVDYAEDEPKPEIFTCRFGTEEKCAEFKAKLEEMIQLVASSPKAAQIKSAASEGQTSSIPTTVTESQKPLSELFKKQEGSWDCSGCYINNKKDSIKCVACGSPQPGFENQVAKEKEEESKKAAEQVATFSFGFKAPQAANSPFGTTISGDVQNIKRKEKANQLQLPESFFDYEGEQHSSDCIGCRGCDPDRFYFFEAPEEEDVLPIVPAASFNSIISVTEPADENWEEGEVNESNERGTVVPVEGDKPKPKEWNTFDLSGRIEKKSSRRKE